MIPTQMLGFIGMPHMILLTAVLVLLFGAKKLPDLARGLGKSMGEFKKAREEYDDEDTHAVIEVKTKETVVK